MCSLTVTMVRKAFGTMQLKNKRRKNLFTHERLQMGYEIDIYEFDKL